MSYLTIYKGKRLTTWARELGISVETLRQRVVRRGWEEAIRPDYPGKGRRSKLLYQGLGVTAWAKRLGVTRNTLNYRVRAHGWERAVLMKP